VALEKAAMLIFVASKALKRSSSPLQTFEQLKTLLLALSQEEAVSRIY